MKNNLLKDDKLTEGVNNKLKYKNFINIKLKIF